jgi:hypothetical protein
VVFAIALAITSIPVISRIMHMTWASSTPRSPEWYLQSQCSRIFVLYVVLATAIGFAGTTGAALFGLPSALGITTGSHADLAYHVTATLAFLAANQDFFAVLVLLAIITSLAAGTWLERVPRHRLLTRPARTAGRAMVVEGDTVT